MQVVSDRARAAFAYSHVVTSYVDVLRSGSPLRTADGDFLRLDVAAGGSLDVDGDAAVRRSGTLSIIDTAESPLLPLADRGPLSPNTGVEVRVTQGIVFDDGVREVWPVGTLPVFEVRGGDWTKQGPTLELTLYDRARVISERRLPNPFVINTGALYTTVIRALLGQVYPDLTFRFTNVDDAAPTTLVLDVGDDPWQRASEMARACGCDLYFDPLGVCVMEPTPDYITRSVDWTYTSGTATSTLIEADRALSREGATSHVIVESSGPSGSVSGEAYDENPASLTYWKVFGDVPTTERLDYAASSGACTGAAAAILRRKSGLGETLSFTSIPNSAHEARDVIGVTDPETGAAGTWVLDKFSLPIGVEGLLSGQPRARRVRQ